METKGFLSKKLSDKGLVWTGLVLVIVAIGMHLSKLEFFDLFVVALLLIGSLMLGSGVGKLYFEPNGKRMNLDSLGQDSPVEIPNNTIRGTNLFLSWGLLYLVATSFAYYYYDLNYWIILCAWLVFVVALVPVFNYRSRKYFIYPDRLHLYIGFPKKVSTDIYFKDISTIKKSRIAPYAWSGMPLTSFNITNTLISFIKSVHSEFGGAMTNDYGGAGVIVVLNNKEVYFLSAVLFPEDVVAQLNKIKQGF